MRQITSIVFVSKGEMYNVFLLNYINKNASQQQINYRNCMNIPPYPLFELTI